MTKSIRKSQSGFTIVEFMIAALIFTLVLLLCSMAIVHVGKLYYKGVITNRTQEAARRVMDDLTASIQFGPAASTPAELVTYGTDVTRSDIIHGATCIGGTRYTYAKNAVLGDTNGTSGAVVFSRHVLWRDRYTGACVPVDLRLATPSTNGQEMLSRGMRIPLFSVGMPASASAPWPLQIRVVYGDEPALFENNGGEMVTGDGGFVLCRGVTVGGQFCAVSPLKTSVEKRL